MSTAVEVNPVSDRINAMEQSATLAMAQAARDLAAKGVDVINLSVGEPDFTTPGYIKEAAKKAIDEGYHFYSPVPGYPDLRAAIAKKLKRDNNIDCTAENIVVSTGAKQSIANVILSLVNPGDEVVILAPYWVSYKDIVQYAEGVPVIVEGKIENDFKPTIQDIEAAVNEKTKVIMYSSPSNPAGTLFTAEDLEQIANVVKKYDNLFVMADEIYEYINYVGGHASMAAIESVKDRVITVNGFSKGFAMTGWRIGYICAPVWLAKACNKFQGQVTSGTNSVTQKACVTALEDHDSMKQATNDMAAAYIRRRDLIISLLKEVPGVKINIPQGAFYIFPDVSAYFGKTTPEGDVLKDSSDISLYLLSSAHVSSVAGDAFGAPSNIRMSFATSDEKIKEAIDRVKDCLSKLS